MSASVLGKPFLVYVSAHRSNDLLQGVIHVGIGINISFRRLRRICHGKKVRTLYDRERFLGRDAPGVFGNLPASQRLDELIQRRINLQVRPVTELHHHQVWNRFTVSVPLQNHQQVRPDVLCVAP